MSTRPVGVEILVCVAFVLVLSHLRPAVARPTVSGFRGLRADSSLGDMQGEEKRQ